MTERELFTSPPALFSLPMLDVERAKVLYLVQYAHIGCGGSPVAWRADQSLGCTGCAQTFAVPAGEALGKTLRRSGIFRSIVI